MDLKQFQQKHKLTTAQMARNCDMAHNTYKDIRDKGSRKTAIENVDKIVRYTGLDWEDFIKGV